MKIGNAFPSKYIKAEDLGNKEHTLTILKVEMGEVGKEDAPEMKPVCYFVGKAKGLVLNKTNAETIAHSYGDDTDEWTNKPVIVYPDRTMFGGKMVDCIRLRTPRLAATDDGGESDLPF